jgi:hypothetical protein
LNPPPSSRDSEARSYAAQLDSDKPACAVSGL